MSEKLHPSAKATYEETLDEFRDGLLESNKQLASILLLCVELMLEKPKNQKILHQVHEAQERNHDENPTGYRQ